MDTRSVVRSRRRSTRLTVHPTQGERAKPSTKHKKRVSGHSTSGNSSSSASRESSCPGADTNSKKSSSSPNSNPRAEEDKAANAMTKEATTDSDNGAVIPLFPNLPSSQANVPVTPRTEMELTTAPSKRPVDTPSEKATENRVRNKWVKTARGSIRLASDTPREAWNDNADTKLGDIHEGQNAPSAAASRRSTSMASMSPDMMDEETEVERLRSRRLVATSAEGPAPVTAASNEPREQELEMQRCAIKLTTDEGVPTHETVTHHDELPAHDGKADDALYHKQGHIKKAPPIPELLADIERIILSSPLAARDPANDRTNRTSSPTPAPAAEKRETTSILSRSRSLRRSSRSIDSPAIIGENLDLECVDSDSSHFDGAYDHGTQGQKKKTRVQQGKDTTSDPFEPRGTKRGAQELSDAEGNAPSPVTRQRRDMDNNHSTPEFELSSPNPIEAATSRDSFVVDDPNSEMFVDISEFARRSGEPPNPVTLGHMISNIPELDESESNSYIDSSIRARDGSYDSSSEWTASVSETTQGQDGSRESGPLQRPEEDKPTCGDCGRAPERYLVCAKCLVMIYCGKYCQLWNWPVHKLRCAAADEAVQEEVDVQEKYLGDTWDEALKMLKEENMAGGRVESVLLGEAVHHSPANPAFMGRGKPHGFGGVVNESSWSAARDPELTDRARAMSIRVAQATSGMQ
ncbi:hypothetical protein DHEL01_v210041 [Diaporthe helianthi]|uniref:MYND-type domain-containing protein n=1 Tax=Diaporthe helianthi TaxID=158607 RepID=A0A2P5HMU2_DIAHE|nr:hypothetical protein DHEL01_v210041 [Diaporthe helianthi]